MKFAVYNLGCKVNAYECEGIASSMEKRGWTRVDFEDEADAYIIFTCAVTNTAASKTRKYMHRARRRNEDAVICMAGCYVQADDGRLNDADILAGTGFKEEIPDLIDAFLEKHEKIVRIKDLRNVSFEAAGQDHFEHQTRAYLKIQDGCNQFCTYCVIPFLRGRERSLEPDRVIEEAKKLAAHHSEIVLTGIHTGRYGREFQTPLSEIMRRIIREVPELKRLRISSIEITEITDDLIDLLKKEEKAAHHLHIPLQSGSDAVLKRMGRPYTTAEYLEKIRYIREEIPDVSISCDLIVGFPQESEEEFRETVSFLKECEFSFIHVFPYSSREGTKAAAMEGHIPPQEKKRRAAVCGKISKELQKAWTGKWCGKEVAVIAEQYDNGYTKGYSSQYVPVWIKGQYPSGSLIKAEGEKSRDSVLFAEGKTE